MKPNRQAWLDLTKRVEGETFVNDPRDPGGPCKYGVTVPTLTAWRRKPATVEDIQRLSWDDVCPLYSARYWGAVQGDKLPAGLDVAVADMAVHSGVRQAARTLQRVLACEQDVHIGPETLERARAAKLPDLLAAYRDARMAFLKSLPTWATFGPGWERRVMTAHAVACSLADAQADEQPRPSAELHWRITTQAIGATAGAVLAALPAARDAYQQATSATAPLADLATWVPAALGLVVAVLTLGMLARRALKLANAQ